MDKQTLLTEGLVAKFLRYVRVDTRGFVTATLTSQVTSCPTVGFTPHLDTFPGVSGADVSPIVHENYDGLDIQLPGGQTLMPSECKDLRRVVGHTIVTSDGRTLWGRMTRPGSRQSWNPCRAYSN